MSHLQQELRSATLAHSSARPAAVALPVHSWVWQCFVYAGRQQTWCNDCRNNYVVQCIVCSSGWGHVNVE
jgi:hypothetical protein